MIRRSRPLFYSLVFLVSVASYCCSRGDQSTPATNRDTAQRTSVTSDSLGGDEEARLFEDSPAVFDTTVQLGNTSYRLHVDYHSLNDNAIQERVWLPTPKGDTPGVYRASNREIQITAYQGNQRIFSTNVRKEQLEDNDTVTANETLGAPEFEGTEKNTFLFGASIAEADADEGDWVEFAITPQGKVVVRSRSSLSDEE